MDDEAVLHSGFLKKLGGGLITRNQRRWFEIRGRVLYYYKTRPDSGSSSAGSPRGGQSESESPPGLETGRIVLTEVTRIEGADEPTPQFTLEGKKLPHPYALTAASVADKKAWIVAIRQVISEAKERKVTPSQRLFITDDSLLVRVCTWNVSERVPSDFPQHHLAEWLTGAGITPTAKWVKRKKDLTLPNIIAITLQEVDMTAMSIAEDAVVEGKKNPKAGAWKDSFSGILTPQGYSLVSSGHGASVMLLVYSLHGEVSSSDIGYWRARVFRGLVEAGNKGAIAIRMRIRKHIFCFIGSHLAPHPENVDKRNEMYHCIFEDSLFERAPFKPMEHDYVIWAGDLNYRMKGLTFEKGCAEQGLCDALRKDLKAALATYDQLSEVRTRSGQAGAFQEFHEPAINFYPTYKIRFLGDQPDKVKKKKRKGSALSMYPAPAGDPVSDVLQTKPLGLAPPAPRLLDMQTTDVTSPLGFEPIRARNGTHLSSIASDCDPTSDVYSSDMLDDPTSPSARYEDDADLTLESQYNVKNEAHHLPSYTDRILYYARAYTPTPVMRLWRPPPLVVRPLPQFPNQARPPAELMRTAPEVPEHVASVGLLPLDYSDALLHTDHRQVFALFTFISDDPPASPT
ncbi:Polyphosphatidylinositol phosphatase INP52 [Diplonema papillatum]|nr:Polyphosphatidylinositol phosphatase INP52 [Diplonema papillatum]|eukprot:gene12111-18717_t